MKHGKKMRSAATTLLAVVLAGCASAGMGDEPDPDQALFRVENDTGEMRVTVSLDDMEGNVVPLGVVPRDEAENFVTFVPEQSREYRLIAVGPQDEGFEDHVVSEPFTLSGGATVNWFILDNSIEVSGETGEDSR